MRAHVVAFSALFVMSLPPAALSHVAELCGRGAGVTGLRGQVSAQRKAHKLGQRPSRKEAEPHVVCVVSDRVTRVASKVLP